MNPGRVSAALLGLALLAGPSPSGPYDIPLKAGRVAPTAQGHARLVFAASPFGIAVTADGHASYDVQLTLSGLPAPDSLGMYSAYVVWAVTPDLDHWYRLGTATNGTATVGRAEINKFLLVITAEASATPERATGPIVLRGYSPSIWLQSFITHPLFRGVY